MVKRKFDEEENETQPVFKRRPTISTSGSMDVDMSNELSSEPLSSNGYQTSLFGVPDPNAQSYPPTSQTLYPFPIKNDEMDCDEPASSPDDTTTHVSKAATDPAYARILDNRFPSDASDASNSSTGLLQPRSRNESCGCACIPKLVLANYGNEDGQRTLWSHCEGCGAIDMVIGCSGQPIAH